ncbi:pepP [Candida oxycetoniae]|uniref:PepP n=1 Tax=Candida oxycetoniae TaxID=497107 RepID=A0AAI9WY75_9ASCO|nr:pepP [Candida oxycetoniae]KAI3404546.2 pepP [Candida oxycetoniae]
MTAGPASLIGKKYPSKKHAEKVFSYLNSKSPEKAKKANFFISGEDLELYKYCDQTKPFRQNRYFFYLSGCNIPGAHVLYKSEENQLILFLPDVDKEDIMWSGLPLSKEDAEKKFDADEIKFVADIKEELSKLKTKALTTDLNNFNKEFWSFLVEKDSDFFYALDEARAFKDDYEIELMKHAAKITDNCHLAVMSAVPIETNEMHIHAEFAYHALRQGSKNQAYDPICCSGETCSTLHWVKNDGEITEDKRSILIDAGAEWDCYSSDVTRCFPVNGDWTKEHLEIYNLVLKMQEETYKLMKPGANWEDLHFKAHRVLIEGFLELGIFKKEYNVEEIFNAKVSAMFFPHGLGHMLGLDTHDTAGYANYSDPDPFLRFLRIRRKLEPNMVVTNEPGCYFSPFLLEETLNNPETSKYIDRTVLDKYWYIGGVRIEDDVLITKDGHEVYTKITKDPKEISDIVKAGIQKGKSAFHTVV